MTAPGSDDLRVGLLGCGALASYAHLQLLGRMRDATLVAAADPDAEARARASRQAGITVHEEASELLARLDVDAVVIAAPTPVHAELAVAAAETGKHFYVEKPLAATVEDGRRVVEAVADAGVSAAVGFNRRLHPLYRQARALLRSGSIGRVRSVHGAFCEPVPPETLPDWKRRRASGGGVLLDLASHHLDTLQWLLGDEAVAAFADVSSQETEDDTAWLRVELAHGAELHGFYTYRAAHADHLELIGERGTLRVDRHRPSLELRLDRRRRYGTSRRPALSGEVVRWRLGRPLRRVREVSFRRSLEGFVALAREGRRGELASVEDGLRNLEVLLEAEPARAS